MKGNANTCLLVAALVGFVLTGCDSGEDDTLRDIRYYVKGNEPKPATHADIMIVAPGAAGPGLDTLRFPDEPLPWHYHLRGVDVDAGALVLEACVESGIVAAQLDAGDRGFTMHGFGEEYVPHECAWGRIGPAWELPPPPNE